MKTISLMFFLNIFPTAVIRILLYNFLPSSFSRLLCNVSLQRTLYPTDKILFFHPRLRRSRQRQMAKGWCVWLLRVRSAGQCFPFWVYLSVEIEPNWRLLCALIPSPSIFQGVYVRNRMPVKSLLVAIVADATSNPSAATTLVLTLESLLLQQIYFTPSVMKWPLPFQEPVLHQHVHRLQKVFEDY